MLFWIHISTSARKIQVSDKKRSRRGVGSALAGGVDYSFTPPTAMPAMMYLLKAKYTMISGSAVMVRPR